MKKLEKIIIIIALALGTVAHVEAKDPSVGKFREFMGLSFTLNQPGEGKKYQVYLRDNTGFEVDALPPEDYKVGSKMMITKGDRQVVKRTKKLNNEALLAVFEPLQVCIKDAKGKPRPNVRVLFQIDENSKKIGQGAQITATGTPKVYVMTDKRGMATLSLMWNEPTLESPKASEMKRDKSAIAYFKDGPFSVVATHGKTKVVFHLKAG